MLPKVYYNDECSICNLEINHYKKKCNSIEWTPIHKITNIQKKINKTPKQIIRRIHVNANNNFLVGIDAFIFIWSHIPKYKFLSKFVKLPIVYHFAVLIYEILAFFLYLKNYSHVKKLSKKI